MGLIMHWKPLLLASFPMLIFTGCSDDEKLEALLKHTKENMVFVKGGTFMMGDPQAIDNRDGRYEGEPEFIIGSPENKAKYPDAKWLDVTGDSDDDVQHEVTLSDFYISKYEVTWAEYDAFCELTGREKNEEGNPSFWRQPEYPTEAPTWQEAKDYCLWLGEQSGQHYDLPTEAQWEYAARSRGEYVAYATNDGTGKKSGHNYPKNEINIAPKISPVGSYPSNPLGLYDMSGNKREWVNDWYTEAYNDAPVRDPKGPKTGVKKVLRGGTSREDVTSTLVYNRYNWEPNDRRSFEGFRCVLNPQ